MAAAEDEGDLGHIGNHRDSVGMREQRIRQSLIRHGLDLLQHFGRGQQATFFARTGVRNIYNRDRREQRRQ